MASMKQKTKLALLFVCTFIFCALPFTAAASASPSTSPATVTSGGDVGFYVRAVIPENQLDANLSYFDLRMAPNQSQLLEVEVVNETAAPLTLDIAAISASTNSNGIIDYRTPDIRDETLDIPFSEIAEVETPRVEVPANGTARAQVRITMPAGQYDGTVLGGIVLTRNDNVNSDAQSSSAASENGAPTTTDSANLQNVYNYVVGVKLTETDAEVLPDFELVNVLAESVNYFPSYVHYLRNKEAAIVKGMDITVEITRSGDSTPIATVSRTDLDMAPNSVLRLAVSNNDGGNIDEGEYNTVVTITHEGETWRYERTFIVGQGEIDDVNQQPGTPETGIAGWLIVLLILLVLILLLLLFLLLRRRREENEEEDIHETK